MTSGVHDRIVQAAEQHAALLSEMSELDYAPSTLQQQELYLNDLKVTLNNVKSELAKLKEKTNKEHKDHQELRDSIGRKYAHKITGRSQKFEQKIEKEEREFLEAHHKQKDAEDKQRFLEASVRETENRVEELSSASSRYQGLRSQYEELYRQIFEGDTPEFPEEDQMEMAVKNAEEYYSSLVAKQAADSEALKALGQAEKFVNKSVYACDGALRASKFDLWGGGMMADVAERDNLSQAQAHLTQAQLQLAQAVGLQSAIGPFNNVNVASGRLWGDVIFDNTFSDIAFHRKIKQTSAELTMLQQRVKDELKKQKERLREDESRLKESKLEVASARSELEKLRKDAFEAVLGDAPPSMNTPDMMPPPAYTEGTGVSV